MSGELPAAGAPAPAAPPAVPPPVIIGVSELPKPAVPTSIMPDDALKQRLEQAKSTGQKELLAKLGLNTEDELAAVVKSHKDTLEAQKTEQQKAVEREAALLAQTSQLTQYKQAVESTWNAESAKLTPEQLKAVTDIAGDDPAMRVRTLNVMRTTWATAPAPAPAAPAAGKPPVAGAPPPAPAPPNSAPLPGAPPPAGQVSPDDHKARYEALRKQNPVAASRYFAKHERDIYPDQ